MSSMLWKFTEGQMIMRQSWFLSNTNTTEPWLKDKSMFSLKIRILETLKHKARLSSVKNIFFEEVDLWFQAWTFC